MIVLIIMSILLQMKHRKSVDSLLLLEPVHKHLPTFLLNQVHIRNDVASFRSANRCPTVFYSHNQVQGRKRDLAVDLNEAIEDFNQVRSL